MSDLQGAWSAPAGPAAPAPAAADRARLLPTVLVAVVIAAVVLGGLGLDRVLAEPSAGTLAIGASVTVTAAPGWVLSPSAGDSNSTIQLRKSDAILTAQIVSGDWGDSAALIKEAETELDAATAQISFGDDRRSLINGNDTSSVQFQATVSTADHSGVVDGEAIAMIVGGHAVVFEVAAPQGRLDSSVDDVSTMLQSVRVAK